jgi:hypothetical protein
MDFCYVVSQRRDDEGNPITGTIRGVEGFENGLWGPTTPREARRVQALMGGDIVHVDIDGDVVKDAVNTACHQQGLPLPYRPSDFEQERFAEVWFSKAWDEAKDEIGEDEPEDEPEDDSEDESDDEDGVGPDPEVLGEVTAVIGKAVDDVDEDLIENPVSTNLTAVEAQAVVRRLSEDATELFLGEDEERKTVLDAAGKDNA